MDITTAPSSHALQQPRTVHTERVSIAGNIARYRLTERDGVFFLQIVYMMDEVNLSLGRDFATAASLFGALCKGTVTPCTARDVLEDLMLITGG